MDSKAIRTIVVLGVMAVLMMTMMMMFTLDQVADTDAPRIAQEVSKEFATALADEPPAAVRLTMTRDGKGPGARRVYKLRLRPNAAVAAEASSLSGLMYHASELCAAEVDDSAGAIAIRCVAELADGGEKETIYVRDGKSETGGLIRAVAALPTAETTER